MIDLFDTLFRSQNGRDQNTLPGLTEETAEREERTPLRHTLAWRILTGGGAW